LHQLAMLSITIPMEQHVYELSYNIEGAVENVYNINISFIT
jgi:hypothetical protein